MTAGILLAVAVHDAGAARLEPAAPDRLEVRAGEPLRFRISYRLADSTMRREDAVVEGELRVGRDPPLRASVEMHDRPLRNDARLGDLVFDVAPLVAGTHTLRFRVRLRTSDQSAFGGAPHEQSAHVEGSIDVVAV